MLPIACLCGRIRLTAPRPDFLNACNCRLCRAAGAWWGYVDPANVAVEGETASFRREDKAEAGAILQFCPRCGTTTHFVLAEATIARFGNTMMGVNMALVDEAALTGLELRFPDGRAWDGAGAFGYVRPPRILGAAVEDGGAGG